MMAMTTVDLIARSTFRDPAFTIAANETTAIPKKGRKKATSLKDL